MAYNVRYRGEFNSLGGVPYTVLILQKDYEGEETTIELTGTPVKHQWQTDEAKPAIKGSSLTVSLYNSGSLPINTFYAPNDDEFRVVFSETGGDVLFIGYLVQDDCSELMVDYKHEIVLSFSDNLGLLKDVALNDNLPDFGGDLAAVQLDFIAPAPDNFIYLYNTTFIPEVGVPFTVDGHIDNLANDTWTPILVEAQGNGNWLVQVVDLAFGADTVSWPAIITSGGGNIDLLNRNTLLNIIFVCLHNTGLELDTYIYANLFETTQTEDRSFLEQTYIDAQTFLKDTTYDSCYDVLTKILERFNLTLFQAEGAWRIMRWDELRYGDIPYYRYDNNLEFDGTGTFTGTLNTGFEQTTYPEVGLTRSIFRPFQFVKETFNYHIPKYLVKNYDLQTLGPLITSYVDGSNTVYEYEMPDWLDYRPGTFPATFYIRVTKATATDIENDRYIVIIGQSSGIIGTPFEVSMHDLVKVEYTFRTTKSQGGSINYDDNLLLTDGSTDNYADEATLGGWDTGPGWNYNIPSGDNSNIYHTVTIDPGPIPFDGLIYVILLEKTQAVSPGDMTFIKDLRITYIPYINDSAKVIGHIHNNEQDLIIKNNEDIEVVIDDSPRNSITGTLFRPSFSGILQERALQWYRLSNPSELLSIGQILTFEQLFWRRNSRTKLEGVFYGIQDISMLLVLKNVAFDEFNFVFGSLEIDYRNNSMSCTMWEIYEDDEVDGDLTSDYTFNYIYE